MSVDTSTVTIEGIDLDADIPCHHSQHAEKHVVEEPACYRYRWTCPACRFTGTSFICESGWVRLHETLIRCTKCDATRLNPFETFTLIERLRS